MTREEAIKILKEDGCGYCTWQSTNPYECENKECKVKEALEMAIKALSQEPSEEVKEVEQRYEETIDKMQRLVDRMKTERMAQAEFEQYAKEHGYYVSTTNIIEQIRDEIEHLRYYWCEINPRSVIDDVLQIIDKYK